MQMMHEMIAEVDEPPVPEQIDAVLEFLPELQFEGFMFARTVSVRGTS